MLSRSNRFHGHNAVTAAYQRGQTVRTPSMSLRYNLNQRRQAYRAAIVVSKKVSKSAVVRNRIRRRLYEILRNAAIEQPYDLVLSVYAVEVAMVSADALQQQVMQMLQKAKVITAVSR